MKLMLEYLFGEKRPYVDDAHSIEWSCDESILSILHRSKSTPDLGKKLRSLMRSNPRKRPPLVLMMASASTAFCEGRLKSLKCLNEACVTRFVDQTRQMARAAGQDPDVPPPRDQSEEDFYTPDETCHRSGERERLRMAAASKYGDYYETNPFDLT